MVNYNSLGKDDFQEKSKFWEPPWESIYFVESAVIWKEHLSKRKSNGK